MNTSLLISYILVITLSTLHAGSDSLFLHLQPRMKKLNEKSHFAQLTGKEHGLMLQLPKESKISFPKGMTFVLTPNGQRIDLNCKTLDPKLTGIWVGDFSKPHKMVIGAYKYHIAVTIDGKKYEFSHTIDYSTQQTKNHSTERRQQELNK